MEGLSPERVCTPCFVVDLVALRRNLEVLGGVSRRCGARILLAQKAFSMYSTYPLMRGHLRGVCSSSVYEARLGREEFGGEVHAFAAAYSEADVRELVELVDCLVFNSFSQWRRFRPLVESSPRKISCGLRVNPEHSEAVAEIYSPCAPKSRLGIRRVDFEGEDLSGIDGLHFHTLCEQDSDALERTLTAFESRFGEFIPSMKWVNFGGGHHITRPGYDIERLERLVTEFRRRYGVETIYLEPGEAVALNAGSLYATVLDVVCNDGPIAILDASAAAHTPDVIEMPYRPPVRNSGLPGEKRFDCRLAGHSCLAGDVFGDYSFDALPQPGDKIEFLDMAIYSMVKTNTFNGLALPSIATYDGESDEFTLVKSFSYENFKTRLS